DKLMDVVAETSDALMERYLEGEEISREEMAAALKDLVTEGKLFPVGCGAATRNIGSRGLLDLIVEGLPAPSRARNAPEVGGATAVRGGPVARRAPRPADRRDDRRRPVPDARRGDAGADAPPVRGGGGPAPAARAVPGDDPQAGPCAGPVQEADGRPRPVRG